ncbi:MAG: Hpt domain-containing protein [Caldilineaceae bacterium]
MKAGPVIDRETIDMLREMDEITEDSDLLLELIDDFLTHSTLLVSDIHTHAHQEAQAELAATSHSLKGASLNIGALLLFQVCDAIELMARNQQLAQAKMQLPALSDAFASTTAALAELRDRTNRGEMIDDLLGDNLLG